MVFDYPEDGAGDDHEFTQKLNAATEAALAYALDTAPPPCTTTRISRGSGTFVL